MNPGIYLAGRSLQATDKANHQFIILVPTNASTLGSHARFYNSVRYVLIGAYSVRAGQDSFLRASMFASSDDAQLKRSIDTGRKLGAQLNLAEVQMCLIDPDQAIQEVYRCFTQYKSFEGKGDELRYPSLMEQFDSSKFNSNSWANSCIFWGCSRFGVRKNSDFSGIDIGNDRLIPKKYFRR